MFEQRTLKDEIWFEGGGLHTGRSAQVRLLPAPPGTGILFVRIDQDGFAIPARQEYLDSTRLSTSLSRNGIRVTTVEHLLASLMAMGVDNVRVEVNGPEVPILDGSGAPFTAALQEVGLQRQKTPRQFLTILKPIVAVEGDRRLAIFPANDLRVTYAIDFPHPAIGYQERSVRLTAQTFAEELAPARTFCLYRDVEEMHRQGLALGGNLKNAVVVGETGILTGPLRYPDEFVRHKILDLLGDLALLGRPVRGHLVAFKAGHGLHAELVTRILRTPDAWTLGSGRESLPASLLHGFDRLKAGVLPGQIVTA